MLIIIFISTSASAQNHIRQPSNNEEKFLELYGTILGVKSLQIVCNKHFSEYIIENEIAYNQWEKKFNKYLEEVEDHFSYWIKIQANKEKKQESEIREFVDNYMMDGQNKNEKKLLNKYENFNKKCARYPEYLMSKFTNIQLIIEDLIK